VEVRLRKPNHDGELAFNFETPTYTQVDLKAEAAAQDGGPAKYSTSDVALPKGPADITDRACTAAFEGR
jgi:hypothetical protein